MNQSKRTHLKMLAGMAAIGAMTPYQAMASVITRPISLVVPFPPGGVADTIARPFGDALSTALGAPVVIENKAGGAGTVGIAHVSRATVDGQTLLLSLSSISMLPQADAIMGRRPMFSLDRFTPIARLTADPTVLVVNASSPYKTLEDFLEFAKKNPRKLNYGSSGYFGTMHVPVAQLENAKGVSFSHIPYTGAGPAVAALLGSQVEFLATGPASIAQHVKAGKVRVLAHWGEKDTLELFPGVPSLKSKGINAVYTQWSGLFIASASPKDIIKLYCDTVDKLALSDATFRERINATGSPLQYLNAKDFAEFWAKDILAMQAIAKTMKAPTSN